MNYRLTNPEPYIIELINDRGEFVWRKDIRDLNYPAPTVVLSGPVEINEICPDTGRYVTTKLE